MGGQSQSNGPHPAAAGAAADEPEANRPEAGRPHANTSDANKPDAEKPGAQRADGEAAEAEKAHGEKQEAERLLPLVYEELRRLAHERLAREPGGQIVDTTSLVHEAYLRLAGSGSAHWANPAHFFAAAAEAMRRILVERARKQRCIKHGGGRHKVSLEDAAVVSNPQSEIRNPQSEDLLALDEALSRLERFDKRKCEIVSLRYFAGLTVEETAGVLEVSPATVKADWSCAKAWLHRELSKGDTAMGRKSNGQR